MPQRRTVPLLATALGVGLLLAGAPAASAAGSTTEPRAPHTSTAGQHRPVDSGTGKHDSTGRGGGKDGSRRDAVKRAAAAKALEQLRRAVLADVARADASVVKRSTAPGLTSAHADALAAVAAGVRADLAALRVRAGSATTSAELVAVRRAVPAGAGVQLAAVTRAVAAADLAVARSSAADAALAGALADAVAAGKDTAALQAEADVLRAAGATARVKVAGEADAAVAAARTASARSLARTSGLVGQLKGRTGQLVELAAEVAALPVAPAPGAGTDDSTDDGTGTGTDDGTGTGTGDGTGTGGSEG